jgi:hypothetical protein
MSQSDMDDDRCRVITEVAIEKAMDKCGSEEAVRRQLERIVGMDADEEEVDCDVVLAQGMTEERIENTRMTREWVMCRAWEMVREEDMTLSNAVAKAWTEARAAGDEMDTEV